MQSQNRILGKQRLKTAIVVKTLAKKIAFALVLVIVSATFVSLGLWQWSRAGQHQQVQRELEAISNLATVPLTEIHSPRLTLDGQFVNRQVEVTGRYITRYIARGQAAGDLEVVLLETTGEGETAGILVARSIIDQEKTSLPQGLVRIRARLLPAQQEDYDPSARLSERGDDLARISSALIEGESELALYDGYLLLQSEQVDGSEQIDGGDVTFTKIPDQIAAPTIPGYYWQHIAYVVIWFLMAAVTLYLPFYQRRRTKLLAASAE